MSFEAIRWAFAQAVPQSSAKFVLVAMATHAGPDWTAWPSVTALAAATSQDRKTVMANMAKLVSGGFMADTGDRKGVTKQVVVYRLNSTENGTVKEYQKRNSPKNGTVPEFPSNSPVFPSEQSRFSVETVPKTGHGISQESVIESVKESKSKAPVPVALPDWLPADAWKDWVDHRKAGKNRMTPKAEELSIRNLSALRDKGLDPVVVIENAIERGWRGLYPPPTNGPAHPGKKPSVSDSFAKTEYKGTPDDELPDFLRS